MALIIYTDPHIGVNRAGNTTPASREALRQSILDTVIGITDKRTDTDRVICLGDLFDRYSNPEPVIRQGMRVLDGTMMMLAGNHDVVADADKIGSLELLEEQYPVKIIRTPFNTAGSHLRQWMDFSISFVPHTTTQALFEESLSMAAARAETDEIPNPKTKILCLHCNYNSPHELTETSINLTPEWAERLLGTFDYIFLGHEHQPRDLFDGRLIILGNVHPTGFSDISDKRVAVIDETGMYFQKVWDKADGYAELNVNMHNMVAADSTQFIRVTGEVSSESIGEMSKSIANLWKTNPNLLALRSEVTVEEIQQQDTSGAEVTAETLPALVERELATDPAMQAMWQEFTTQ